LFVGSPLECTSPIYPPILADRGTFNNVGHWIEAVRAERGNDVLIMLVGHKTDLADKRCG
jgi:GTPase SAR1 family protein